MKYFLNQLVVLPVHTEIFFEDDVSSDVEIITLAKPIKVKILEMTPEDNNSDKVKHKVRTYGTSEVSTFYFYD